MNTCSGTSNDIIEYATLQVSPLAIAAMHHTKWTTQLGENHFALDLNAKWAAAWIALLQNREKIFSVIKMIKNKEREYLQMCILDIYIEQRMSQDKYELRLGSWSSDTAHSVDAILRIWNNRYPIDFTLNVGQLHRKIHYSSSHNQSKWIVHFDIRKMQALVDRILQEYTWDYDRVSLINHLRSMDILRWIRINLFDKKTGATPRILQKLENKVLIQ